MTDSPFKLFEPYGPGDKEIYFGRDAEIFALYHLLQQTRLLLIYGASGTGKTSLINAGLPKAYKMTSWFCISVRRRDDINASFRQELARQLGLDEPVSDLNTALQELYESRWIPIHLVFDQFEEVFTLGKDDERRIFFQDLQSLLASNLPCKILISMREEYIGYLYDYERIVPTIFEKRFRVEPIKDSAVEGIITQMCKLHGIEMEVEEVEESATNMPSTAQQIMLQLKEGKQAVHLPYLQVYLHYLYRHAMDTLGKPLFNAEGIAAVGQLGNVLRGFILTRLEETQHYLTKLKAPDGLAQHLLDEFATDEGTKRSCKRSELVQSLEVPEAMVNSALYFLSDTAKLLRADEDDVERYEPVHDTIAKQINELRSVEQKEFKIFAQELQIGYARWEKEKKNKDRLLLEQDLEKVELYLKRLKKREEYAKWVPYFKVSKARVQRKRNLRRYYNIGVKVVAVVAVIAAVYFSNKYLGTSHEYDDISEKYEMVRKERKMLLYQINHKKSSTETVDSLLVEAKQLILNLDYNSAWDKMIIAASLDTLNEKVATAMLEPALWNIEIDSFSIADSMLGEINKVLKNNTVKVLLQRVPALADSNEKRKQLRSCISELNDSTYNQLMQRYYPAMVRIPEDKNYKMGPDDNGLVQWVQLDEFEMAATETTVWQWAVFCKTTKKDFKQYLEEAWSDPGDNPVVNVTWYEAVDYANWLNERYWLSEKEPLNAAILKRSRKKYQLDPSANGFRLPTEAEWEYAAAGGEKLRYGNGKAIADPKEICFDASKKSKYAIVGESPSRTLGVTSLNSPNVFGLHGMSGNANEWCWDWYGEYLVSKTALRNPLGPLAGKFRIFRGGSWFSPPERATVSWRSRYPPNYRVNKIGFRLAKSIH